MSFEIYDRIPWDWYQWLLDEWKEKLAGLGFEDANIQFCGFGSQGDGASFTAVVKRDFASPAYLEEAMAVKTAVARLNGEPAPEFDLQISARIERANSWRYANECMIDASVDAEYSEEFPELDRWLEELRESLTDEARTLSRQIYRELEAAYDAEVEFYTNEEDEAA